MNKGQLEKAKRRALNLFDKWNSITGMFDENSSYYCEVCGCIEDAVEIGAMTALNVNKKLPNEFGD